MDRRDLLRSNAAILRALILMAAWTDAIIVTLISMGAVVLVGILGYLIEKKGTEEDARRERDK